MLCHLTDELRRLEAKGFGKLCEKGKGVYRTLFCKPHPNELSTETPELKTVGLSFDKYKACFYNVSELPEKDAKIALEMHPNREQLVDLLSQPNDEDGLCTPNTQNTSCQDSQMTKE